jgi:hypothetical protein
VTARYTLPADVRQDLVAELGRLAETLTHAREVSAMHVLQELGRIQRKAVAAEPEAK